MSVKPRDRRQAMPVAARLYPDEIHRLDLECWRTRLTRSDVLRLAVSYYLDAEVVHHAPEEGVTHRRYEWMEET